MDGDNKGPWFVGLAGEREQREAEQRERWDTRDGWLLSACDLLNEAVDLTMSAADRIAYAHAAILLATEVRLGGAPEVPPGYELPVPE